MQGAIWWGQRVLPANRSECLQVGPLKLWMQHISGEWRLARSVDRRSESAAVEIETCDLSEDLKVLASLSDEVRRITFDDDQGGIKLVPALADMAVVATPEYPLSIPANQRSFLYVGSPLWIQLMAGASENLIDDSPILAPDETWFGANPRSGEICYASRSFFRLSLANLEPRPHRATTRIEIHNHSHQELPIEQVKLPAPNLSLYWDADGRRLWTEDLRLNLANAGESSSIEIRPGAPADAPKADKVAEPRLMVSGSIVTRALISLFQH